MFPFILGQFCQLTSMLLKLNLKGKSRFPVAVYLVLAVLSLYQGTTAGYIYIKREDLNVVMQAYQTEVPAQLDNETYSSSAESTSSQSGIWNIWGGWTPVSTWNVRVNIATWSS